MRVQPRASRSEVVGWRADGALAVRVSASPVEGAANAAVADVLAASLGVPRSTVHVVRGEHGRDKLVEVAGLTLDEVTRRLGGGAR